MTVLYEGTPGVRINADNDNDLDLDLMTHGAMFGKLWLGRIGDDRAEKVLTPIEIRALRDACARMLVDRFDLPKDKAVLAMIEAEL